MIVQAMPPAAGNAPGTVAEPEDRRAVARRGVRLQVQFLYLHGARRALGERDKLVRDGGGGGGEALDFKTLAGMAQPHGRDRSAIAVDDEHGTVVRRRRRPQAGGETFYCGGVGRGGTPDVADRNSI